MKLTDLALRTADAADALPIAPARLAERVTDIHFRRRRARAETDPTWAAIEKRRETGGPAKTLLSDDLTWADWEAQHQIERALTPDRRLVRAAHKVKHWTARRAVRTVIDAAQRARRGWADSDTWNLDTHLWATTADMLDHLADHTHGWPDHLYGTFEDWQAALRATAAGLRGEIDGRDHDTLLHRWAELTRSYDSDPADIDAASASLRAHDEAVHESKVAAMRWVADHHGYLWD